MRQRTQWKVRSEHSTARSLWTEHESSNLALSCKIGTSERLFHTAFEPMKTTMYPKQHDHASHRCGGAGRL